MCCQSYICKHQFQLKPSVSDSQQLTVWYVWQDEGVTCIYSSPFMRALQTAHQVANVLDLPVIIEYGLSEGMLERESSLPAHVSLLQS